MRITREERAAIVRLYHVYFPKGTGIWLFGSRVDDQARGGDIDLFIDMPSEDMDIYQSRMRFLIELKRAIGDQKIDVVIKTDSTDQPIYKIAQTEGIKLA